MVTHHCLCQILLSRMGSLTAAQLKGRRIKPCFKKIIYISSWIVSVWWDDILILPFNFLDMVSFSSLNTFVIAD